jgi:hypothetical protein
VMEAWKVDPHCLPGKPVPCCEIYTDKKENQIFLKYKEIQ